MRLSSTIKFVAILAIFTQSVISKKPMEFKIQRLRTSEDSNTEFVRIFNNGLENKLQCLQFGQTQEIVRVCKAQTEKIMFECEKVRADFDCGTGNVDSITNFFSNKCNYGRCMMHRPPHTYMNCLPSSMKGFDKWLGEKEDEPQAECKAAATQDIESKMNDCKLRHDAQTNKCDRWIANDACVDFLKMTAQAWSKVCGVTYHYNGIKTRKPADC
jgi:hypothetical protein